MREADEPVDAESGGNISLLFLRRLAASASITSPFALRCASPIDSAPFTALAERNTQTHYHHANSHCSPHSPLRFFSFFSFYFYVPMLRRHLLFPNWYGSLVSTNRFGIKQEIKLLAGRQYVRNVGLTLCDSHSRRSLLFSSLFFIIGIERAQRLYINKPSVRSASWNSSYVEKHWI